MVKVSVVALPIKVSVTAGMVTVPDAVAEATSVVVPDVEPLKLAPALPTVGVVRVGEVNVGELARTLDPVPVFAVI